MKRNCSVQHVYRGRYELKDGYDEPPPGFGYELDEGKTKSSAELL